MNRAVHAMNYAGTYVHINRGRLETMRIVHAVSSRGEHERLLSLNGEAREVLRDSNQVTCILPAERLIIIGKPKSRGALPSMLPDNIPRLRDLYDIERIGPDRVAGYATVALSISPKDKMRYGYRVWLERDSGMLLRSDILSGDGRIMEQMMFTEISMQTPVTEAMLRPTVAHAGFRTVGAVVGGERIAVEAAAASAGQPTWTFDNIPKGFKITGRSVKRMPMKQRAVEHIMLSDGLAVVSVYIEKTDGANPFEGASNMGGISAYGRAVADYQVTVMGEAPGETVKQIAHAIVYSAR